MSQPRPAERFLTLEIARFLAAFCVATDHLATYSTGIGQGSLPFNFSLPPIAGVFFFFVLSGFVIQNAHGDDAENLAVLPRYIWRRVCRIFPLYWLSLIIPLWFIWSTCSAGYLAQIFTLSPFSFLLIEVNPPAWTLRFELAFYIVFGLGLLPRLGGVLLPLWVLIIVVHWYPALFHVNVKWFFDSLPQGFVWFFLCVHNLLFVCGIEAAVFLRRFQPPGAALWALLGAAVVALLVQAPYQLWGWGYPSVDMEPFTGLTYGTIIFALAALERGGHLRPPAWTARLGSMSYPLYLFHAGCSFLVGDIIVYQLPALDHRIPTTVLFLGLMLASLALAAVAAFVVDKPFQRFARRLV